MAVNEVTATTHYYRAWGYACGRQDEKGVKDSLQAGEFARAFRARRVEYDAGTHGTMPTLSDAWNVWTQLGYIA